MTTNDFSPEFEGILADCLDAVLSRQLTIADCLERYPEYAADLRPELEIALLTARLRPLQMPSGSVDALEARLRERMASMPVSSPTHKQRSSVFARPILRWAAVFAAALVIALGTGSGAVAASANSLPGDPLYGVKRLWESILLVLAPLTGELDDLWLRLAETRLDELTALQQRGDASAVALADLYLASANTLRYLDGDEDQARVQAFMQQASDRLTAVTPLPESAALYQDVVQIMQPRFDADGDLQAPAEVLAPSLMTATVETPVITLPPSLTPSPETTESVLPLSPTVTETPSPTLTETPLPSATATATSRIPATATRTPVPPSATPTFTLTWTPSPTPTSTWTPLPLPVLPTQMPGSVSGETPTPPLQGPLPTQPDVPPLVATERIRATQLSVYMTQTVEALTPTPSPGGTD